MNAHIGVAATSQNIWLTARVRMISERKARRRSATSLIILTYYSLLSVTIGIFSEFYKHHYSYLDQIGVTFSVVVLASSLVIAGFRFDQAAEDYRSCYLKLQKLNSSGLPPDQIEAKYTNILGRYPNHTTADWNDLIVYSKFLYKSTLKNNAGNIDCSFLLIADFIARKFSTLLILAILILSPIFILTWPLIGLIP